MRLTLVTLLGLIFLAGCEETETPISEPLTLEEQLREVMQMPLAKGTGKVVRTISYCCEPQRPFAIVDTYYPVGGDVSYLVQKSPEGDTLQISLQYYKEGNLQSRHSFRYRNGMLPELISTNEYIYDSRGNLVEWYSIPAEGLRSLVASYLYDAKGRLTSIVSPAGNGVEELRYAYDEEGRIMGEWRLIKTEEEYELGYMFYRYEGELLVAKEATKDGKLEGPRQDQFRYVYDGQGRLVAQYEFDPYFFFQLKNYAEFFYE